MNIGPDGQGAVLKRPEESRGRHFHLHRPTSLPIVERVSIDGSPAWQTRVAVAEKMPSRSRVRIERPLTLSGHSLSPDVTAFRAHFQDGLTVSPSVLPIALHRDSEEERAFSCPELLAPQMLSASIVIPQESVISDRCDRVRERIDVYPLIGEGLRGAPVGPLHETPVLSIQMLDPDRPWLIRHVDHIRV